MKKIYYLEYIDDDVSNIVQADYKQGAIGVAYSDDVEVFDNDTLRSRFMLNDIVDDPENDIPFKAALKKAKAVVHYMTNEYSANAPDGAYEVIVDDNALLECRNRRNLKKI